MKEKQKDQKRFVDPVFSFSKARVLLSWSVYSVCVIIILGIAEYLACRYWECLLKDTGLARNFILVAAAFIGLPLAIWRSAVAQQQSETAQRGLLNERYQKGADMLGSEVLSVRLGGIDALENLAREHAEDYHIQIVKLFCAFVRNPPKDDDTHREIREDVQAIMTALGRRNEKQQEIEKQETSKEPILNLVGASLFRTKLLRANLSSANLSRARLMGADLSGAYLKDANLSGASLDRAHLSGVKGLTQAQLDQAVAYHVDLPDLTDAKDSQTGKPLEWDPNLPHRLPNR